MRRIVCQQVLAAAVAAGVACAGGLATDGPEGEAWQSLSPEQQLQAHEHYQRFQSLPEQDRERVSERYRRWRGLPPEQRQRLRQNYESYQRLDPDERQRFNRGYQTWKASQDAGGSPLGN